MAGTDSVIRGFVVFEGIDGSGTTTQLNLLRARLESEGIPHAIGSEPTGGAVGRLIRQALAGREALLPETVARLFAADRGEHVRGPGGIAERAAAGELVVSDRYLFSSLAYQGRACGPELPAALNAGFPLPELLIFFDIDPEISMGRIASRPDRDIYETLAFQREVALAYRSIVASYAGSAMKTLRVDASKPVGEVECEVWQAVSGLLGRA